MTTDNEAEGKPTTISAAEWDTVAEDVKARHCQVKDQHGYILHKMLPATPINKYTFRTMRDGYTYQSYYSDAEKFTVTWLTPPQPEGQPPVESEKFLNGDIVELVNDVTYQDGTLLPTGAEGYVVTSDVTMTHVLFPLYDKRWILNDNLKYIAHRFERYSGEQPPPATAEGSEADVPVIPEFLASMSLEARQEFVRRFNESPNDTIPLEALTEEQRRKNRESYEPANIVKYYEGELTALRNRLQVAEDTVRGLRELCGRAAVAIEKSAHVHVDAWNMLDDLRLAAKEGEE